MSFLQRHCCTKQLAHVQGQRKEEHNSMMSCFACRVRDHLIGLRTRLDKSAKHSGMWQMLRALLDSDN
eukprot:2609280-Amphidinium_carterae.2